MAEIGCKKCTSPDCKGCNTFILETALKQGKFDALMDENRTVHIAANVRENVEGEWKQVEDHDWAGKGKTVCSKCHYGYSWKMYFEAERFHFCPNCGADMTGGADNGQR